MIVKHRLNLDLIKRGVMPRIDASQDDRYSRELELHLLAGGIPFTVPEDATVLVRYQKPDGTGGAYDTLPDGTCAWRIADGVLTVALAPQVCTAAGTVELAVTLLQETSEISTFRLLVDVQESPGGRQSSREYVNIKAFLPQPGNVIKGQYLMVTEVDAYGNATVIGSAAVPEISLDPVAWPTGTGVQITVIDPDGSARSAVIMNGADGASVTDIATEDVVTANNRKATEVTITVTPADPSLAKGYTFYVPHGKDGADGKAAPNILKSGYVSAKLPKGRAKGDVDGDGQISTADKTAIQDHANEAAEITDPIALWAGDVNSDGDLGAYDAALISQFLDQEADYGQYAADYYGNWQYDGENGYFYYDVAISGMTESTGVTVIPAKQMPDSFAAVKRMAGAIRFCFTVCPVEEILCRILYGGDLAGITMEAPVESTFLDVNQAQIVQEVLAALPVYGGEVEEA